MKDLFGYEVMEYDIAPNKRLSPYQKFKRDNNYRNATGNHGKRCKNCKYHKCYEYHNKNYHKCSLLGESHSTATDIKVSFICDKYKRR